MPRNKCQFHPDSLFSHEKLDQHEWMEFWKFKRFYLRKKGCFCKIKKHATLLHPNVSHYHSVYFYLKFIAVWGCFPQTFLRNPFNLKLGKKLIPNWYPQATTTSYCKLHFQMGFNFCPFSAWILLFCIGELYISISIAFCTPLVRTSSLCKRNSTFWRQINTNQK